MSEMVGELTGTQKVAVVLMNMGRERASVVMKQFTEAEAEVIASEIIQLRQIDAGVSDRTLTEFHEMTLGQARPGHGGHEFAQGLLEASFGAERAAGVLGRVATSMAGKAFEFLDGAESSQILNMIRGEMPQTIALVLAHLRREQASALLSEMEPELRTDVAECIATMGSASPDAIRIVTETLKKGSRTVVGRDSVDVVGGVQPLVEMLNRSNAATERAVLEALDERDPVLAEEVRSRLLTFADIVKFESRDVQQVLRGIDASLLAIAMKGAAETVATVIRSNLSERNRDLLDDEAKTLGPVRVSQVEEARAQVVRAIRDMEAQGTITMQRGVEEEYVK